MGGDNTGMITNHKKQQTISNRTSGMSSPGKGTPSYKARDDTMPATVKKQRQSQRLLIPNVTINLHEAMGGNFFAEGN